MSQKRICFDRILPRDLRRFSNPHTPGVFRMAVVRNKKWLNGSTLRVAFLEGTSQQHQKVKDFAPEWCQHANLNFNFVSAHDAEIRIAFQDDGAWSYIGTDCRDIPLDQPTMNFGWLDRGVVLHEFGHAIGLIHEHQNPSGGIKWDKDVVYRDLSGSPNFWDRATIDNNMFKAYSLNQLNATAVDPKSIMMYPIPNEWTLDDFETGMNDGLSTTDRSFIGSSKNYPKESSAKRLVINGQKVSESIGKPGEQDVFEFAVTKTDTYTIETYGKTDVVLALFGPQSNTQPIAEDDDSGSRRNAKITIKLDPATYRIQVRHFNVDRGKGTYQIDVGEAAAATLRKAAS
jgi:hypothetical protein